jgi:hypothetical protein
VKKLVGSGSVISGPDPRIRIRVRRIHIFFLAMKRIEANQDLIRLIFAIFVKLAGLYSLYSVNFASEYSLQFAQKYSQNSKKLLFALSE